MVNSLGGAFGKPPAPGMPSKTTRSAVTPSSDIRQLTLTTNPRSARPDDTNGQQLLEVMAPLVKEGKVHVTQSHRCVSIEIHANVLFAPERAEL